MKARLALRDKAELWLAAGVRRWRQWFPKAVEPYAPQPLRAYAFGDVPPNAAPIPRTIWAYWSGSAPPDLIRRCFANWHAQCPGFDIRILDAAGAQALLGPLPPQLAAASEPHRADWIRLELLRRHGGIWLDASTILTAPLDWVLLEQARTQSDFVGYYLGRYTSDPGFPVVENWFMAAPPASPFITDLQREFTTQTVPRGGRGYVEHLQSLGVYEQARQRIDIPHYLGMHLAAQRVLRAGGGYRLALARAEDGPFLYHALGGWSRTGLKLRLLFARAEGVPLPPLVKLRKPDRKRLGLYLERALYVRGSIMERYLCPPQRPPTDETPQDTV